MIVIGRMAGNIESIEEWLERGHNQMNSGNYDEAIKCFDQALVIDPKNAIAWNNKGASLSNSGKHEEAIKCFDIALAIDPNYASARYNRASSNVKQGDLENGLSDLKNAVEMGKKAYIELAKQDKNFDSIRNDERFKLLIGA